MNGRSVLKSAISSLTRAPIRSVLTTVGVVVGVAAVVVTASIGNGAKSRVLEVLAKPEARAIYVRALAPPAERRRWSGGIPRAQRIDVDDYHALRRQVRGVAAATPQGVILNAKAQSNGRTSDAIVEGVDVDAFVVMTRKLEVGSSFNPLDVRSASSVCMISESLARFLFSDGPAVSRPIRINGVPFLTIGVVQDVPIQIQLARPADLRIYIPYTSLLRRLDPSVEISVIVQAIDVEHVPIVQSGIADVMEQRRSGRKTLFTTTNAFDALKTYSDSSLIMARLIAALGTVSLIVGGLGIMNIMLMSVTERAREIGIRLAIGTRSCHVLAQILTESIVLSLSGGVLGVACGWAVAWFLAQANGWPMSVTAVSITTALLCSVAVGAFFGYHPARNAAALNPVEALRLEH